MARSSPADVPASSIPGAPPHDQKRPVAQGNDPSDQQHRMDWRAAGAQFYPGGAYDALHELQAQTSSYPSQGLKNDEHNDARLREMICERLCADEGVDTRDVSVDVSNCDVTLLGTVPVRQQMLAIEDIVAGMAGVNQVHNQLSVNDTLDFPPPNDGLFEG